MVDLHPALGARAALIAKPPHELVTVFTPGRCLEVGALEVMDTCTNQSLMQILR